MADKTEIADIILYDGSLDELNAHLERTGASHRYEIAGFEFYGPETRETPNYHISRYLIRERLEENRFDGVVNKRVIVKVGMHFSNGYVIHGTPIRLVEQGQPIQVTDIEVGQG